MIELVDLRINKQYLSVGLILKSWMVFLLENLLKRMSQFNNSKISKCFQSRWRDVAAAICKSLPLTRQLIINDPIGTFQPFQIWQLLTWPKSANGSSHCNFDNNNETLMSLSSFLSFKILTSGQVRNYLFTRFNHSNNTFLGSIRDLIKIGPLK